MIPKSKLKTIPKGKTIPKRKTSQNWKYPKNETTPKNEDNLKKGKYPKITTNKKKVQEEDYFFRVRISFMKLSCTAVEYVAQCYFLVAVSTSQRRRCWDKELQLWFFSSQAICLITWIKKEFLSKDINYFYYSYEG